MGQKKAVYKSHQQEIIQQYSDSDLRAIYRQGEDATVAFMKTLLLRLDALKKRVEELTRHSSKASRTSSKPPSSDGYAKPKTLCMSSGKPLGAEPGHLGETLRLRETPDTTVISDVWMQPSIKRGMEGIKAGGILHDYHGILVHDCWRPYFALASQHALCNAHLLRELLAFVEANPDETWASDLVAFLRATWYGTKAYREHNRKPSLERT